MARSSRCRRARALWDDPTRRARSSRPRRNATPRRCTPWRSWIFLRHLGRPAALLPQESPRRRRVQRPDPCRQATNAAGCEMARWAPRSVRQPRRSPRTAPGPRRGPRGRGSGQPARRKHRSPVRPTPVLRPAAGSHRSPREAAEAWTPEPTESQAWNSVTPSPEHPGSRRHRPERRQQGAGQEVPATRMRKGRLSYDEVLDDFAQRRRGEVGSLRRCLVGARRGQVLPGPRYARLSRGNWLFNRARLRPPSAILSRPDRCRGSGPAPTGLPYP